MRLSLARLCVPIGPYVPPKSQSSPFEGDRETSVERLEDWVCHASASDLLKLSSQGVVRTMASLIPEDKNR